MSLYLRRSRGGGAWLYIMVVWGGKGVLLFPIKSSRGVYGSRNHVVHGFRDIERAQRVMRESAVPAEPVQALTEKVSGCSGAEDARERGPARATGRGGGEVSPPVLDVATKVGQVTRRPHAPAHLDVAHNSVERRRHAQRQAQVIQRAYSEQLSRSPHRLQS